MFDIVKCMLILNIFLFLSFLDMNINSILVHAFQGKATIQSIKIPNREKENPITILIQRNAMGNVLMEAQRLVGNGKHFLPTCLGEIIHIRRFCDFIDQATAQWNCALVRNLYAPHVTISIVKKPPRLEI